jgi:hypothetical protein
LCLPAHAGRTEDLLTGSGIVFVACEYTEMPTDAQ